LKIQLNVCTLAIANGLSSGPPRELIYGAQGK